MAEKGLLIFQLQKGDELVMCHDESDGIVGSSVSYSFDVTEEASHMGNAVKGILRTPNVCDELDGAETTLIGSGWGGSMMTPGLVVTDRHPYFQLGSPQEEYRGLRVDRMTVLRMIGGEALFPVNHIVRDMPAQDHA
ncbi:MAG: hypothetical protein JWO35_851 [Candidatus Saccharibacteria bacterium]|nr:hypothetical protein [Candidatus Saccharibacteria bacterium]